MARKTTLIDLLVAELKDLYSAEHQWAKALPRMAKTAAYADLATAFENHLEQTREHVQRLEYVSRHLNRSLRGKPCKAMHGLIAEARQASERNPSPGLHDLALIGAAQRIEHYQIAGYGTARTLAEAAGEHEIAELLQRTLEEETATDRDLAALASTCVVEAVAEAAAS